MLRLTYRPAPLLLVVAAGLMLALPLARADDPRVKVETVLTGLSNPCGIAIHESSGHVFISDSAAHRVIRFDPKTRKTYPVITGFPEDIYGKGPKYAIGPLGLLFLDDETLVVGGGGLVDGKETVQVYTIPPVGKSIKAEDCKYELGPIAPGEASAMGEGNFYDLVADGNAIYISSNGDDTKGWVLRIPLNNGTPTSLEPFIATKEATEVDAPVGLAIDAHGMLVVGQMGEVNVPGDSLYTVYNPKDGSLLTKAPTGLHDIAGLAFSPKSGKLYCVDFAWIDAKEGGLFRLDISTQGGETTVKAVKLASLDKPSALAFAADGTLYVTVFGPAEEGVSEKPGSLVKITGDL